MSPSIINRSYARSFTNAQIVFIKHGTGKFESGVMRNYSVDGMCFISRVNLFPGDLIDIQIMEHPTEGQSTGLKGRGYGAEVIWCKKISESRQYLIGVRFYKPARRTILQG